MFNPCNLIFLICYLVTLVIITIIVSVSIALYYKHKKVSEVISRYTINVSAQIDETIPQILEQFIQNCFNDYLIISGEAAKDVSYISEEKEKELRNDLKDIVIERISSDMIDKLSIYYNKANIGLIISDKIYIIITNYVIQTNASLGLQNSENINSNILSVI